jgi:hypothetical protein
MANGKQTSTSLLLATGTERKAWSDAKAKISGIIPFTNLPYCMDDKANIAQTNTMLHHIARTNDLMMGDLPHIMDYVLNQLTDLEANHLR